VAEVADEKTTTAQKLKIVMKFGGSSVRDAERITEVS
jgi:aspartokinase